MNKNNDLGINYLEIVVASQSRMSKNLECVSSILGNLMVVVKDAKVLQGSRPGLGKFLTGRPQHTLKCDRSEWMKCLDDKKKQKETEYVENISIEDEQKQCLRVSETFFAKQICVFEASLYEVLIELASKTLLKLVKYS